ncbi:MAG: peptidase M48 family protein, partial [Novosphingobium sp.]
MADDIVLARVAHRLVTANVDRCSDRVSATGLMIAAIDQFPPALRSKAAAELGFATPLGLEGVVPGSPADTAGVRAGDGLVEAGMIGFAHFEPAASASNR